MSSENAGFQCNESSIELLESYGKPLLETDFTLAVIYCCIVGVALIVGVFGNIIIMIITAGTRAMNNIGRDFVMNLAMADLCVSGVADPLCILGKNCLHLTQIPQSIMNGISTTVITLFKPFYAKQSQHTFATILKALFSF